MQVDELELNLPPYFELGEKVRTRKLIRNDGTFPGREIGETLAKKGDVGYVVNIGTFLQNSYIYAVHFLEKGYIVGCRRKELESLDYVESTEQAVEKIGEQVPEQIPEQISEQISEQIVVAAD